MGASFIRNVLLRSHVQLFMTPWTVAHQAPLPMGFPRKDYWSELPSPPPEDLPDPETEPASPAAPTLQADSLLLNQWGSPLLAVQAYNLME